MNILQDLKQNQFHQPSKMSKSSSVNNTKKVTSLKSNHSYEIQMQIGITYNQILQMIKQNNLHKDIKLPEDGIKSNEKLDLIKTTFSTLINQLKKLSTKNINQDKNNVDNSQMDESNAIQCSDCQNYQNNLQKLQNQVRQHIRLEQQLKIYQQSMQQKIQELKKQKVQADKKSEDLKKKYEEQKHSSTGNTQKLHKLQFQNQKLKVQIKQLKQTPLENSKKIKGYQTREKENRMNQKENRIDWVHRMSSVNKKDQKQTHKEKMPQNHTDRNTITERTITNDRTDRKSVQKRGDSSDRWRMSGARSTKLMNFNEKIIQEKNKQQRKKAIQSKFQYRR